MVPVKKYILVSSKKNTYIKYNTLNTKLIRAHRTLCECELYALSNYDNDPEMKEVMQQFDRQSSQRFLEYDEHMQEKRRKCKEHCDKDIQKIILKDRIEKELAEKFVTLQTDISINDIPTCVCEKSVADKVEKGCLKCAQHLGGIGAPSSGVLGEIAAFAIKGWKTEAIAAATELAKQAGAAAGLKAGDAAGLNVVIGSLKRYLYIDKLNETPLQSFFTSTSYNDVTAIANAIDAEMDASCGLSSFGTHTICALRGKLGLEAVPGGTMVNQKDAITRMINGLVGKAKGTAKAVADSKNAEVVAELTAQKTDAINTIFMSNQNIIIASVVAIVVIVLIMVIIYLILRYRPKKKMKKKLQYIKLLEE
ncbi:hypothetical protein PFDG_00707 [Plasmodium falciparum Dd2]|uniref:Rifin n=1 Tax=Plasmodium falciparum (isolate Dd2) TaxID=57267 RepID=A0A0L7LX59_PLAF4|nr:hypothetical protein PFDG_00707 [Plasmodium falciparum Dd2]